mmetsp:Transcript_9896/g.15472  ORF Transcript_9896/g.15472 Transcript_9896/m.15472 type:complete len:88 (-) Transcript_9896:112-375(-)
MMAKPRAYLGNALILENNLTHAQEFLKQSLKLIPENRELNAVMEHVKDTILEQHRAQVAGAESGCHPSMPELEPVGMDTWEDLQCVD